MARKVDGPKNPKDDSSETEDLVEGYVQWSEPATENENRRNEKRSDPEDLSQAAPSKKTPEKTREEIELEQEIEGFKDVSPDRADGWFQPAPGAYILGRLLGRFVMAGNRRKPRAFYQVKVKQAGAPKTKDNPSGQVFMVSGKGEESTVLPVLRGSTLALDERKALEVLSTYAESDGVFDVYIKMLEKVDLAGGEQTFWRCEIRAKALRPPTRPFRSSSTRDDDDIPF